jgi:acylglycerol lipase
MNNNGMNKTAEWLELTPGNRKYVYRWLPSQAPWANVAIVHGLGEHGGRYHPLAEDLTKAGLAVSAFDQQGHGRSSEPRGRIRSYRSLLDDVADFLSWNNRLEPTRPTILFGHSMGGNLVINYTLRDYALPAGAIASSPMIRLPVQPKSAFLNFARVVSWVLPNTTLRSKVVPEHLMSDPVEQQLLREDELFHSQLTLRLGGGLLDSGPWAIEHASRLSVPLLLTHGTRDTRTCHLASAEFAQHAGPRCQLELLEGELHDPFRGLERQAVIARFVDFVRSVVQAERST